MVVVSERAGRQDGTSMVVVGVGGLGVIAVLIWMALLVWDRPTTAARQTHPALSADAVTLSYRSEEDFRADQSLATAMLHRVLAGGTGGQIGWENPVTGNRGVVWNGPENAQGCRDIARRAMINKVFHDEATRLCKDSKGRWPADITWAPR
jgi:hypothetical protein